MKKKQSLVYAPKVNAIFEADIGNWKKALSGKPLEWILTTKKDSPFHGIFKEYVNSRNEQTGPLFYIGDI